MEQCLTEWFDEVPYPGPDEELSFVEAIQQLFGGIWDSLQPLVGAYGQSARVLAGFGAQLQQYAIDAEFHRRLVEGDDKPKPQPRTITDQDKPAHLAKRNSHGPYEGVGYTRRGRKRY